MSRHAMDMEINRNLQMMAKLRYPLIQEIPSMWPMIVKLFEEYTHSISYQVIKWKFPERGYYKCNSDGACKGNPGPSACGFCIRN
ncbi:hypothetical protein KY290_005545 [Solanum tuberosum]|uniref:Uncharacterized protein n=1 Tax=Solanum tuberosum TaxID=4113 RepID=A0ABQ7WEJ2_SOLTU|nr:hypothetical protein KY290_005545 [Solanum tuberosum]